MKRDLIRKIVRTAHLIALQPDPTVSDYRAACRAHGVPSEEINLYVELAVFAAVNMELNPETRRDEKQAEPKSDYPPLA